jgi:hypothetical protein
LNDARPVDIDAAIVKAAGSHRPWVVMDLPTENGKSRRVIDFASAGATGKQCESWLPAANARPPRPAALLPADGAELRRGSIAFSWRGPASVDAVDRRYTVAISDSPTFERTIVSVDGPNSNSLTALAAQIDKLQPNKTYYWKIVARNSHGQSDSIAPYKRFRIVGD